MKFYNFQNNYKLKTRLIFVLCIVIYNGFNIGAVYTKIVRTTNGLVRGKLNCYNGFKYYSFQGIPYAESPTGFLRFKPPIPKKPWTHVLDATEEGCVCPQWNMRYKFEQMSEDCLRVNVYVPQLGARELPVLVFIHGGAFAILSGSSDYLYGPQFFLQREMIVVTLNYRIGPLGFLSLGINEASGNAGIKDIILALKWIKKNIPRFGGNTSKITIGGNSSGAALVHYLLLTKKSDNLFQQAILISGSALNYRFLSQHPRDEALSLAKKLGIENDNAYIILKQLQQTDVFEIVEAFKELDKMNKNVLKPCTFFKPCVEKKFSHAVITKDPMHTLKTIGLIQNVPILTGINAEEGLYMLPTILSRPEAVMKLYNNGELCIPADIEYPEGSCESRKLGDSINEMYFHNDNSDNFRLKKLLELTSDSRYIYSTYAWIKLHKSNLNSSKLFFYIFDFDGDLNWTKLNYGIQYSGTSHADELGYIFVTNRTINRIENANNESKHMINITVGIFSNFIKFGTPQVSDTEWPEFNIKDQKYVEISPNLPVKCLLDNAAVKRLYFWENVYHRYQKYVESGGKVENKCRINLI